MNSMDILFLGTGGAWGVPEVNCECLICREMRKRGEKRERTAILLSSETNLLIDCGPDTRSQLLRNRVDRIDGVLISHEHGDHYMGMDELFAYKRNCPKDTWRPVPVYLTPETWDVVSPRFAYLEQMDVIRSNLIEPGKWFTHEEFAVFPFRTEHGVFAKGSVGFSIRSKDRQGREKSLVYTSDFMDLPEVFSELVSPDYLIIQSFWLNEPLNNRPHHMSFQRALHFIELLKPGKGTFLVHIGEADMVPGDPANGNLKKYEPKDPLRPHSGGEPYPIPLNQEQWQQTVDRIVLDRGLPYKVTVAYDDMRVGI
jgi:phosphoribosyl 1,2-cyclic phosphate phosphodiesterase